MTERGKNIERKIRAGIIGGAGYTAGELIRLLVNHPSAEIVFAGSASNAGRPVCEVHPGLDGECGLAFSDLSETETLEKMLGSVDVVFLCSGHGESSRLMKTVHFPQTVRIIDLSTDFRTETDGFIYGLPELQREAIAGASRIANPGCFATAIQIGIMPLVCSGLAGEEIHVTAITGSTGAGYKPTENTHFSRRSSNLSTYSEFSHRHLTEIGHTLDKVSGGKFPGRIHFVPVRGDFTRGIFASIYTKCTAGEEILHSLYREYYSHSPFTVFAGSREIDLKSAVNTNKALLSVRKHGDIVHIVCTIDNLLKGASGQAVENMNLMFGLPEDCGLRLKASAF